MANLLTPYPTDISEPARILLGAVQGGSKTPEVIHAAYQIVGVGLNSVYPDNGGAQTVGSTVGNDLITPLPKITDDEGINLLMQASKPVDPSEGVRGPLSALIMERLMAFALQKLLEFLK